MRRGGEDPVDPELAQIGAQVAMSDEIPVTRPVDDAVGIDQPLHLLGRAGAITQPDPPPLPPASPNRTTRAPSAVAADAGICRATLACTARTRSRNAAGRARARASRARAPRGDRQAQPGQREQGQRQRERLLVDEHQRRELRRAGGSRLRGRAPPRPGCRNPATSARSGARCGVDLQPPGQFRPAEPLVGLQQFRGRQQPRRRMVHRAPSPSKIRRRLGPIIAASAA